MPPPPTIRPQNSSAPGDTPQVQSRIAEQMGGRASFDQIAAQALDLSDPLMARAYALRRLAEFQFPVEANLNPEDLATLRSLQRDTSSALRKKPLQLEQILKPALNPSPLGQAPACQVPTAEDLFQSARRVEKLLAVLFGAAPADSYRQFPQLPAAVDSLPLPIYALR